MNIKICRICMKQRKSNVKIFESTESGELVANILIDFANVSVDQNDDLPHIICTNCFDNLLKCRDFQRMIVQNDTTLARMSGKSPKEIERIFAEPLVRIEKVKADRPTVTKLELLTDENIKDGVNEMILNDQVETMSGPEITSSEDEDDFPIEEAVIVEEEQPRFLCCCCPLQFGEEHEVMNHMKSVHSAIRNKHIVPPFHRKPEEVKRCEMCFKFLIGTDKLLYHQVQFKNSKQCVECGEFYQRGKVNCECKKSTEPAPKPDKDPNKAKERCDICSNLVVSVAQHKKKQHSTDLLKCTQCDFNTYNRGKLVRHVTQTHCEKKYPCPVNGCERMFVRAECAEFRRHMDRHAGAKKYTCKFCSKAFGDVSDRRRHEWQHTGISPYMCSKCNKMFLRKNHLLAHEEICTRC